MRTWEPGRLRVEGGPVTDVLRFPAPSAPPPNRGKLLTPQQVAELIAGVSAAWVRRNVPCKVALGHSTVRWFEADVRAWLDQCRECGK
jgi:predicted DNA-binding transcriptional regulator AlpA